MQRLRAISDIVTGHDCALSTVFPQSYVRPAKTHRSPSGDQLQHELTGATTIIWYVIGKRDADPPLVCHHSHVEPRRAGRKPIPEHRQPVSLGEVEKHCRIAAGGNDSSGGRLGLEPMLFEILPPQHASHAILSIEDHACSTVGIEHGRCRRQLLESMSGVLAARAIAGHGQNRRADDLEFHLAALAHREERLLVHCTVPLSSRRAREAPGRTCRRVAIDPERTPAR